MSEQKMIEKEEFEEVVVKLPKAVMDLIKDYEEDVEEYLREIIIERIIADLDICEVYGPSPMAIVNKYRLNKIIKERDPNIYRIWQSLE